ncbi:uncharacterized protein LOC144118525 [Amblyomma americanum]
MSSPPPGAHRRSDDMASGLQSTPSGSTEMGRQGAKTTGGDPAAKPKLSDGNTTTSNRPASPALVEQRTPSVIIEEVQRSQFRDQRRVATAAIAACGAILIVLIVVMYIIVSGSSSNSRPPPPPAQSSTTAMPALLAELHRRPFR